VQLFPLLTLVAIAVVFWALLVRPQARRQRELAHMQSTLEVGDAVMLTSGVFGMIRDLEEDAAQVEIADGVTIKVARGAIGQVIRDDVAPTDEPEASEEN
jgi:preprotein translocase subunit YajC